MKSTTATLGLLLWAGLLEAHLPLNAPKKEKSFDVLKVEIAPSERDTAAPANARQVPDEARKQLVDVLGGPFLVFRDKVQEELMLSDEQKH
ncbi:MAG: hypothetical protein C5B56_08765, partial [Proteobacteria bacterium]